MSTIITLASKREAIERSISEYEERLSQARIDLGHVNGVIAMFQTDADPEAVTPYYDLHRLFKRGELITLAQNALANDGPLSTGEIAERIARAKGLNGNDKVLRKAIMFRLVHVLRLQAKRGKLVTTGKRGVSLVWKLP